LQPTPRTDVEFPPLTGCYSQAHLDWYNSIREKYRQLERELAEAWDSWRHENEKNAALEAALQSARAAIIEECAKVCDEWARFVHDEPDASATAEYLERQILALASRSEMEGK